MNTMLHRLASALLLLLGLGLPAGAVTVGMTGTASRAAVRVQVPVVMNAYFASPTPINGAAMLTALSLSGSDRQVNLAVRQRVADVLSSLDIEASRVANAPGAADETNEIAQRNLHRVSGYQAQVLETLQLPHVAQHLTKAQRQDVAVRAAAAGVTLTPERTDELIAIAQGEIEKLIAGTRSAETVDTGAAAGDYKETPRRNGLGKHVPSESAAMARAVIPSPAALAVHKEGVAGFKRSGFLAAGSGAANIAAVAAIFAGTPGLVVLFGVLAAVLATVAVMNVIPATRRAGALASKGLPAALIAAGVLTATLLLDVYVVPGAFDAVNSLILAGFAVAAGRNSRPKMSLVFRAASATALYGLLGAIIPTLPVIGAAAIAVFAFGLLSIFTNAQATPRGAWLVALGVIGAVASALSGLGLFGAGGFILWNVVTAGAAATTAALLASMAAAVALALVGGVMTGLVAPKIMEKTAELRARVG